MKPSKNRIKFAVGLFLFCCGYWVLDSVWSYLSFEKNLEALIYREPMSYLDTLMLDVSPYQVVSRIMVTGIFMVTGILIAIFFYNRKKAEDTIREQRDFLNTLLETIPNPVSYQKRDGTYSGCNSAFEKFIGKPRAKILGKTVHDFAGGKMAAKVDKIDGELFKTPGVKRYESEVKRTDGQNRYVVFDKASLLDDQGNVDGLIAVISDMTERKKVEREKRRLERQLQLSQKMESIGTLAGGIAHDFNNILYGTIGFTELCLDDTEPGTILHENLKEVLAGGKRAKALVEQILMFSRQTEKEMKPILVSTIVKEVSKLLRSTIPSTIRIDLDVQAENSTINGDPTQIHRVLLNLSTNAHHAMEAEGGTLKIALSNVLKDANCTNQKPANLAAGTYLKLSISDTGTGIPPELRDRIFDPFFTSKEQGKGTGMGLAVVHGIVKTHKGHIEVASTHKNGTTVDVYFPVAESNEDTFDTTSTNQLPCGHEHVFLVDDELQVVGFQKQMLERLNYTVTSRTSSLEAIKTFKANHAQYDAVITDMTMPYMTGDRLSAELKKIKPGIPVILCTGYNEKLSSTIAEEIGVEALLMKPVDKADLAIALRQVLDN
jgi:PAS domain S-box-containing protein